MAALPNLPLPPAAPQRRPAAPAAGDAPQRRRAATAPAKAPQRQAATAPAAAPALTVRDLGPADGSLLDAVFAGLSPQSRYQRFHGPKPQLRPAERAYLTATDGRDHVALVALDGAGAPLGIARFVRLRDDPRVADIAAEVVDAWQHRGIGSDLMTRLARRAAALGVERLQATVLSESRLRRGLVRRGWRIRSSDGPSTTMQVDVWALLRGAQASA